MGKGVSERGCRRTHAAVSHSCRSEPALCLAPQFLPLRAFVPTCLRAYVPSCLPQSTLPSMLESCFCRARQQRLLRLMYAKNLGAVVVGWRSHAYYFTGHWPFWQHEAAAIVFSDGKSVLVCAKQPDKAATADDVIAYDSTWFSTQRQDQAALAGQKVLEALAGRRARSIGVATPG